MKERKNVKLAPDQQVVFEPSKNSEVYALERPKLFWFILLIISSVAALISAFAPPHVIFMIAFAIAITVASILVPKSDMHTS